MKALYIELAMVWALVAFFNFALFSTNGSWFSLVGGICSLINVGGKIYHARKEN